MTSNKKGEKGVYEGLNSLAGEQFPKKCATCGRVYANIEEFLMQTQCLIRSHGLDESKDDANKRVYLYRNCACGTTLMEPFRDRRDFSPRGDMFRQKFDRILDMLAEAGLERDVARQELRKIFRGGKSNILKDYGIDVGDE